jgi:hypothetical protein
MKLKDYIGKQVIVRKNPLHCPVGKFRCVELWRESRLLLDNDYAISPEYITIKYDLHNYVGKEVVVLPDGDKILQKTKGICTGLLGSSDPLDPFDHLIVKIDGNYHYINVKYVKFSTIREKCVTKQKSSENKNIHVNPTKVRTRKVWVGETKCREILGFEGFLGVEELPKSYMADRPRMSFEKDVANLHNQVWDDQKKQMVNGTSYIRDYIEVELEKFQELDDSVFLGSWGLMFNGDIIPESLFQEFLKVFKVCGERLARINREHKEQQKREDWSGTEDISI